ncbi:MAG: hypothetical protein JEZ12_03240 [Desulfobacterium sp.]|nr:hypothetical protein [Desulfobacterium sp.]
MKKMLAFIGGVAVGILAVTGVYALEDTESNADPCFDDETELEKITKGEEVGENNND